MLRFNAQLRETRDLTMDVTQGFARDFVNAMRNGAGAMQAFQTAAMNALNKIADKLMDMAAQQLVNNAFGGAGGLMSMFGGGGGMSAYGGGGAMDQGPTMAMLASAKGNAFYGGKVIPFARGGIVNRPTLFPMAGGRTGLMGEAGEEGIFPLLRGPGGKLGVAAYGGSTRVSIAGTTVVIQGDAGEKTAALIEQRLSERDRRLSDTILRTVTQARSRRVA